LGRITLFCYSIELRTLTSNVFPLFSGSKSDKIEDVRELPRRCFIIRQF